MKRILCYGDSNTWGHNPSPEDGDMRYPQEQRWTGILQEKLLGKAVILEEGLCGRTIMFEDPVAPYRHGGQFLGCVLQTHQPLDLVILMLGTNDTRHSFHASVKEIAMGIQNLVKKIKNAEEYYNGKAPDVLVIAPAPIRDEIQTSDFYGMYDEASVSKSKQLYQAYSQVLSGMNGVFLIDADTAAQVSAEDCIHLSKKGHTDLAEVVYRKVTQVMTGENQTENHCNGFVSTGTGDSHIHCGESRTEKR